MSRNRTIRTALNDVFWERVSQVLTERGLRYSHLWDKVIRDKNTYTNWRKKRTVPRISDIEEIAIALDVSPADLLRESRVVGALATPEQLVLPFEPGSKGVKLELECSAAGFVLRAPVQRVS